MYHDTYSTGGDGSMEDVNETTLHDIEKELEDIFETDRKGWVKMYRLLNAVETKNLWDYRYGSFSVMERIMPAI